jgi:hypothetical protein
MYQSAPDKEVVVRVVPATRQRQSELAAGEAAMQTYDALVYTQLPFPKSREPTQQNRPELLWGLPLAAVERITITPTDFDRYLADFVDGVKGGPAMRERLLEAMSPGLQYLLGQAPFEMRLWWSSSAPELEDVPWELAMTPERARSGHRLVFLRGLPPENPFPCLPVQDHPRLAVVGSPQEWPGWAEKLKDRFVTTGYFTVIDKPLREAIQEVTAGGFEFLHIFADGIVSCALEGILYDVHSQSQRPELSTGELSRLLSGSRVALLAITTAELVTPDTYLMAGRKVLSAFRAFAYLGASNLPMPSVIAPLGPVPDMFMEQFWEVFYSELIQSWHLTESLRRAHLQYQHPLPIALFCRHAGGKLFLKVDEPQTLEAQPIKMHEDLRRSETLTQSLVALSDKYGGLPEEVREFLQDETARQEKVRGELDAWIRSEEEL